MKKLTKFHTAYYIDGPRRTLAQRVKGKFKVWKHYVNKAKCHYRWPDGNLIL